MRKQPIKLWDEYNSTVNYFAHAQNGLGHALVLQEKRGRSWFAKRAMAGLVKAKKYDWNDSNLALFGSDTERKVHASITTTFGLSTKLTRYLCPLQVKKASAETEKAWAGAGQKVGIQIWRIVKFKVLDRAKYMVELKQPRCAYLLTTYAGNKLAQEPTR